MAERDRADVFVSVDANSAGEDRPDVNGLSVYYYDSGLAASRVESNSILKNVNVKDRGIRGRKILCPEEKFYALNFSRNRLYDW